MNIKQERKTAGSQNRSKTYSAQILRIKSRNVFLLNTTNRRRYKNKGRNRYEASD